MKRHSPISCFKKHYYFENRNENFDIEFMQDVFMSCPCHVWMKFVDNIQKEFAN